MEKATTAIGEGLAKESKVLEYWRKRYLTQAAVVLCLALSAAGTALYTIDFKLLAVLLCLLAAIVAYVMLKELRDGLQARGEGLVFAKGEELFPELVFDVGRGLCESSLLAQEVVQGYQVRECRNVMRGKGFWLEEDWFYAVVSAKYIPVNQTMFEGVVLAFAATKAADGLSAEVSLAGGRAVITGSLAPYLRESGAAEIVTAFLALFKESKARLNTADKTLYIWIKTEHKLFYRFSLSVPNTLAAFQKRIKALEEAAKRMVKVLNG